MLKWVSSSISFYMKALDFKRWTGVKVNSSKNIDEPCRMQCSTRLAATLVLRRSGGAMLHNVGNHTVGVDFTVPDTICIVWFSVVLTFLVWLLCLHAAERYSAVEYTNNIEEIRNVSVAAPQPEPASIWRMFFFFNRDLSLIQSYVLETHIQLSVRLFAVQVKHCHFRLGRIRFETPVSVILIQ